MTQSKSESKESNGRVCFSCGRDLKNKDSLIRICPDCLDHSDFTPKISDWTELHKEIEQILSFYVSDVTEAFKKDPAATSLEEVLVSYPGIKAILLHRVAHFFWKLGLPFVPRYLSEIAHEITGIDIHPGATIGSHVFIDHGTGLVIGETAEVGNNVTLYQGVTLGGTSLDKKKRHPTLGNNIVVGAGAKLLGDITIGDNVKIGANSVVTKDIPPNSIVVGVPGRIVNKPESDHSVEDEIRSLKHEVLPDPVLNLIKDLEKRISDLEKQTSEK